MKYLKKTLALLLAPLMLGGCWQEQPAAAGDGLLPALEDEAAQSAVEAAALPQQFSLSYFPSQSLDPVSCPDGVQQTVSALLCEGLFQLDQALAPQPLLCASYVCDAEAMHYAFTLRPGALFSDGSALTAADVAATLNRARTSARYSERLAGVSSVTAGENGTVNVSLYASNAALPALLDIPIVKAGTEDSAPVGTGPYRLISGDDGAFLESNPHWQGTQPVSRIRLLSVDSADTILYHFTTHETQLLTSDLTGSSPISVTGSIRFYDADTTIFQYVGINIASPRLSSAAARRALSLGINREQMVSAFLSGHGKAAQFPVSPVWAGYPAELEQVYSYDVFQSAMTAAGLNIGGEATALKMIVNEENSFKIGAASMVAAALSAFDLKIEVSVLPWEEYAAALAAGDFDLYYGEVKLTADWDLRPLLSTGGKLNYGGFSDPTIDALLQQYRTGSDSDAVLAEIFRRTQALAPILPVCFKTVSVLAQDGSVENLSPTAANPFYGLSSWAIHLADGGE